MFKRKMLIHRPVGWETKDNDKKLTSFKFNIIFDKDSKIGLQ